ncbi:uncharacterized protein LOC110457653 isoform X2 [Mizuhopecten yessoensis]|uniref:uncharacterized protein LOC110457653 isoform X2 n=1 Tax=Mizuhopecten yessoensis TaxID=6573 RepID=UPI000B458250|nr:uncharacterized protein LOC110457653 isoform X2 [Mizuhopecten yessoensis]
MQDTASFIGVPGGQESAVIQLDVHNSSATSIERSWDEAIRRITEHPPGQLFADDAEDVAATPEAAASSASSQGQKRCRTKEVQATDRQKRKKTAEDVYTIQHAYFEREMVKTDLQITLLKKILENFEGQQDTVSLLAALSH